MLIHANERLDDLQLNGLHILQNPGAFCFGMDAVLLADFSRVKPRERIIDLGTGTGILPLLLSQKQETAQFDAIELQADMADMASRSIALNGLDTRISARLMDMRDAPAFYGAERFDAAVCNPPYGKRGGSLPSESKAMLLSRHETNITIRDVVHCAAALLRNHGRLSLVFPAQRVLELCDALREHCLEPKRARLVCAKLEKPPYLVLLEAIKNAKPSLLWLPPLIVYQADGRETSEILKIYHRS